MTAKLNLKINQGATFRHTLTIKDANGVVIDLTDYTARMQIRDKVGGTVLLELTTENDRIVITPVEGKIELVITAADTEAITWISGVYDFELVNMIGLVEEVNRLFEGRVSVSREVTKVIV